MIIKSYLLWWSTSRRNFCRTLKRQPKSRRTSCDEHWTTLISAVALSTPHLCSQNSKHPHLHLAITTFSSWPFSTILEVSSSLVRTRNIFPRWHSARQKNGRCILSCTACSWDNSEAIPPYYCRECVHSKSRGRFIKNSGRYHFNAESSAKSLERTFFEVLFPEDVQG